MDQSATQSIHQKQKAYFQTGATLDIKFRLEQLRKLTRAIEEYEAPLLDALKKDLNKSEAEAYLTEIGIIYNEISHFRKHLKKWARPEKVRSNFFNLPAKSRIYHEPYGVTLNLSPWNYPFQLAFSPLIGAISAGNTMLLKPSELSPHSSAVISDLLSKHFPQEYIACVEGGAEVSKSLLELEWDFVFFTGSPAIGKIINQTVADKLTPACLELGGKSPAIVDSSADMDRAARKIAWSKSLNAGQICVSADYALVHESALPDFVEKLEKWFRHFLGDTPLRNEDYAKIINEKHFHRLLGLLEGQGPAYGGESDAESLKIAPTILVNPALDSAVMSEEIFGPILPVISYRNTDQVPAIVSRNSNPLAMYIFTRDREFEREMIRRIKAGGGAVNDCILQVSNHYLPFGGVGNSGMGRYHGEASFRLFSNRKAILKKGRLFDHMLRYPPYNRRMLKLLRRILK